VHGHRPPPRDRIRLRPLTASGVRLSAGAIRLGILCLFVVVIGMIRTRLTSHAAGVLLVAGGAIVAAGALAFVLVTLRVSHRLGQAADAVLLVLRRTGLPILGLACFLLWTFVYLGVWWFHPEEAFRGLTAEPRFADFFYYAVSTAFISPPGDIFATSRGARSATMIEMLTGFALLTAYLSSFVDWRSGERRE